MFHSFYGKRINLNKKDIKLLVFGFCRSVIKNQFSEYNGLINLCLSYCSFENGVPRCQAKEYAKWNDMVFHEVSASKSIGIHGSIRYIVLKKYATDHEIYSPENNSNDDNNKQESHCNLLELQTDFNHKGD